MPFEWPDPEQIIYRLWRLRRLLLVALIAPALAAAHFVDPDHAMLAFLVIAGLVVAHLVVFPNGTFETLGLTLASSGLLVVLPVVQSLGARVPADHAQATQVFAGLAVLAGTGLATALITQGLLWFSYAGPAVRLPVRTQVALACSVDVALQHCAIRPQIRRGRMLTGPADARGLFDVAVVSAQERDPDDADRPFVGRATAKILHSDTASHAVMLLSPCGALGISAVRIAPRQGGCVVSLAELPGDFTLGMYAGYWLADRQADHLTEIADRIAGQGPRANGLAHGVSALSLAALVLSPSAPVADRAK